MRIYLRILRLLTPYRTGLTLLAVSVVISSLLSSVGITFISPVLRILFEGRTLTAEVPMDPAGAAATQEGGGVDAATPASSHGLGHGLPLPASVERTRKALVRWLDAHLYQGTQTQMLLRVCLWLFLLYLFKNVFSFVVAALTAELEHRAIYDVRGLLYRSIQALPLGFFSQERTGYLMSRVLVDVDMMRGAIVGGLARMASNGLMVLIALTIVLLVSWRLALATLLVVPPNMLLVAAISRRLQRGSHRAQEEMGDLASVLQETISGVRVVKSFGAEDDESTRFDRSNRRFYRAYVKLKVLEAMSSPVSEVLGVATAVVVLGFGGHLVLTGQLRADLLIMFLGVMLWVIAPIKNLIKVNSTLQQSLAAAKRVFGVIDAEKEADSRQGRTDITSLHDALRLEGVGFCYRPGQPVLEDIDLEVRAGQVVALVGPSGAGKSTLVDLIPRFYEPTSGRITLDGVDLRDIQLSALRRLIGMVSQEVILFHDTVATNIAYGATEIARERIIEAARAANAHEFITELPAGYDTVVGERGTQLSGGQRQRIAIARAILRNPPLLILDEATSALDSESERLVQQAMERLMQGRTTVVIAHRLSTVTRADCIVVMEAGRIVEMGTHEELLRRRGAYRRLHELQFQVADHDPGADPQLAR